MAKDNELNPKNPQTGHGKNKPEEGSLEKDINVVFRDKDGKKMPNSQKDAYGKR